MTMRWSGLGGARRGGGCSGRCFFFGGGGQMFHFFLGVLVKPTSLLVSSCVRYVRELALLCALYESARSRRTRTVGLLAAVLVPLCCFAPSPPGPSLCPQVYLPPRLSFVGTFLVAFFIRVLDGREAPTRSVLPLAPPSAVFSLLAPPKACSRGEVSLLSFVFATTPSMNDESPPPPWTDFQCSVTPQRV